MAEGGPRSAARVPPPRPPPPQQQMDADGSDSVTREVKAIQDEAYLYIQQGLTLDELGQREQAVTLYRKGLQCIDKAVDILLVEPDDAVIQSQAAQRMSDKMLRTKLEIQERVQDLIQNDQSLAQAIADPPPSYDYATSPVTEPGRPAAAGSCVETDAVQIFSIPDGVQIFYIRADGAVTAPSYPSSLGIYHFHAVPESDGMSPPAFMEVGNWTYPLLPRRSPVLHSSFGAYIFPDVTSDEEGNAVGVMVPEDISSEDRSLFEDILGSLTDFRRQAPTPTESQPGRHGEAGVMDRYTQKRPLEDAVVYPPQQEYRARHVEPEEEETEREEEESASVKIASGLETVGEWISWGLVKGAEKTGTLLKKGSAKLREHIAAEENRPDIDPRAKKGLYYTREATGVAVKVSSFAVKKLGQGTMALARMAAPHLKAGSEKILPKSFTSKDGDKPSKFEEVCHVASGGLKGWAKVYTGLETAGKALAKSIATETVSVVGHKYGNEAGKFSEDCLYSVGNVAMTAYTASHLGPKSIAKTVAKQSGSSMVDHVSEEAKSAEKKQKLDQEEIVDLTEKCEAEEARLGWTRQNGDRSGQNGK